MCFSAPMSFLAAFFLAITAHLSFRAVKNNGQKMLAAIPLFFSLQQLAEGIVWSTVHNSSSTPHILSTYSFLFFAFIIWPTWIPASIITQEKESARKKLLGMLLLIGIATSIYLSFYLMTGPVSAHVAQCHIVYTTSAPQSKYVLIAYGLATIVPFFVSSLPIAAYLGMLLALSCLLSLLLWQIAFTSVWCFFAALISVYIVRIIRNGTW